MTGLFVMNFLERMTSAMRGSQSERENIFGPKKRKNRATFPSPILEFLLTATASRCTHLRPVQQLGKTLGFWDLYYTRIVDSVYSRHPYVRVSHDVVVVAVFDSLVWLRFASPPDNLEPALGFLQYR